MAGMTPCYLLAGPAEKSFGRTHFQPRCDSAGLSAARIAQTSISSTSWRALSVDVVKFLLLPEPGRRSRSQCGLGN